MQKRPVWLYVVGLVVLAFGLYLIVPDRNICNTNQAVEELENRCEITYQGVEGVSALDTLKATHEVETQSFSFGELVQSIDGVKAPSTHFWSFLVNGEQAQVGAGDYIAKSTDTISWKLEAITLTQ